MECGLHCFADFLVTRIKGVVWKLWNLRMLFSSLVSNHSKEPVLWRRKTKKKALDNLREGERERRRVGGEERERESERGGRESQSQSHMACSCHEFWLTKCMQEQKLNILRKHHHFLKNVADDLGLIRPNIYTFTCTHTIHMHTPHTLTTLAHAQEHNELIATANESE